ncbi:ATP-NAD kinase-like domain-containing protein [Cokeromyces recurvatus]|uniref:ATP-NAD kinase-like domain-containing protein n=1 Tax=Cokeromyces recurvatus TaxID=90255 RepID=UPI00221E9DF3|nr:ATP-NAD kinase-like domain-containing protein [Cokeromyces recurvatus]KAI7906454.1 ATP-NAD kinase-like domain-containing protein [Cokeromyces recurvatus]
MSLGGTKRELDYSDKYDSPNKKSAISQKYSDNTWDPEKNTVLVITKAKDDRLVYITRQLAEWLIFTPRFGKKNPFIVYVDSHLKDSKRFGLEKLIKENPVWETNLKFWNPKLCYKHPDLFHLIITLGGDGTILFTSNLFQTKVPPIMPFHLGSLGFLAPFAFTAYKQELNNLFTGQLKSIIRMRLSCTVYRYRQDPYCFTKARRNSTNNTIWTRTIPIDKKSNSEHHLTDVQNKWELMETAWMRKAFEQASKRNPDQIRSLNEKVMCYTTVPSQTFHVLNEIVVDRGPSSNISMLELFADDRHLTTVQADGLCIATATGSTAYSLSAHGSLTHPDMQCTLVTPVCPHTLSFRPMLLPSKITIRIVVPFGSRHTAYCSFDGRNRTELKQGDHVKITVSPYPVKTFCACDSSNDWFTSVQTCLQWNMRRRQESFVVVEGDEISTQEKPKPDNLFACLRSIDKEQKNGTTKLEMPKIQRLSEETDLEKAFDLIPWTDEELQREQTTVESYNLNIEKNKSKI